jgi:hypothetical protein
MGDKIAAPIKISAIIIVLFDGLPTKEKEAVPRFFDTSRVSASASKYLL